jgi:hypothetical protein
MRVCILGCGPAGLLAAYAAALQGCQIDIISKKVKSKIPGAVFLHEPIPYLTAPDPDGVVTFIKHGTRAGYAAKVYGNQDADCSWDLFPQGERPAWSMFKYYNKLWDWYENRIIDATVAHSHDDQIPDITQDYDLVISSIPAKTLCHNKSHKFNSQHIYILNKTVDPTLDNTIVYNGVFRDCWYRTSKLFDHEATESTMKFSDSFIFNLGARMDRGYKPLNTDCDCYPDIKRVGRYGRWEKGILVHHAYKQTVEILERWS